MTNMTEATNHCLLPRHIDDNDMDLLQFYLEIRSRSPGMTDEAIALEMSFEFTDECDDDKFVIPDWMQHFAQLFIAVRDCARRAEKNRLQNNPDEIQRQIETFIDLLHKTQTDAAESRYRQSKALLRHMTARPVR